MIQLENVSKIFDTGFNQVRALSEVNLNVQQGEFIAIKGPSGSGKSTMMNIIGLLDRPTKGKYILANNDVSTLNDNTRSHIRGSIFGFVFQSYNLIPRLAAVNQVEMPLIYRKEKNRRRKSILALSKMGLAERINDLLDPITRQIGQYRARVFGTAASMRPEVEYGYLEQIFQANRALKRSSDGSR